MNESETCIFCKLVNHEIPCEIVLETDDVFAFRDLNPQAPAHLLVIPKRHLTNLADSSDDDAMLLGKLMRACVAVSELVGIAESGYRVVANIGADGGQSVDHLHLHVLGGRKLTWPPG